MSSGAARYGICYWCVKTSLSKSGEIYVMADEAKILADGTLSFVRAKEGTSSVNLAISAGNWSACYAASVMDGSAVAVEHWDGEVVR
jgi:hypothetical protein